jgi:hypothetical protein
MPPTPQSPDPEAHNPIASTVVGGPGTGPGAPGQGPGGGPPGDPHGIPGSTGDHRQTTDHDKPHNVPEYKIAAELISSPEPHLPPPVLLQQKGLGDLHYPAYVCIDREGRVSTVQPFHGVAGADETIIATLRTWRYRPQPIPICSVVELVFHIE